MRSEPPLCLGLHINPIRLKERFYRSTAILLEKTIIQFQDSLTPIVLDFILDFLRRYVRDGPHLLQQFLAYPMFFREIKHLSPPYLSSLYHTLSLESHPSDLLSDALTGALTTALTIAYNVEATG